MGNIVSGFLTGIFMYIAKTVLYSFTLWDSGFMEILKFIILGILTYNFAMGVDKFTNGSKKKK